MKALKQIGIDVRVNAAIETHRQSFDESPNDILARILLSQEPPETNGGGGVAGSSPAAGAREIYDLPAMRTQAGERITGRWTVELLGQRVAVPNLKAAYRTLLLMLNDRDADFLRRFCEERARARRFVARSPRELYLSSPGLAKDHAKPLAEGWYFDTNLSTDQVARRVRIAARLCGLQYGRDIRLLNNLEEI